MLRPLIGGWPDPNVPGNPWMSNIREMIVSPHLWNPGVEHYLHDDSFVTRFVGTTSCIPNMPLNTVLSEEINNTTHKMIDCGGIWRVSTSEKLDSIIGGLNITGHTYSSVVMDHKSMRFCTLSTGDRFNAPYDIWVRYTKLDGGSGTYSSLYSVSLEVFHGVQGCFNMLSEFLGFASAGFGGPLPDAESNVFRVIFVIPFKRFKVTPNPLVTIEGDFKVQLPNSSMLDLQEPEIYHVTSTHAIVVFKLADPVPSNTPVLLVYGDQNSQIKVEDVDPASL
jgi:hypothetical protein